MRKLQQGEEEVYYYFDEFGNLEQSFHAFVVSISNLVEIIQRLIRGNRIVEICCGIF